MSSLVDTINDASKRPAVISDCEALLEAEVADKKGISGMGVKAGFKVVKKFKPNMINLTLNDMIDEFAEKIEPFWQECQASNAEPLSFFVGKKVEVANALLGITDVRMERSPNKVIKKTYQSLRPKAVGYIGDAMPRLARLIQKHAS